MSLITFCFILTFLYIQYRPFLGNMYCTIWFFMSFPLPPNTPFSIYLGPFLSFKLVMKLVLWQKKTQGGLSLQFERKKDCLKCWDILWWCRCSCCFLRWYWLLIVFFVFFNATSHFCLFVGRHLTVLSIITVYDLPLFHLPFSVFIIRCLWFVLCCISSPFFFSFLSSQAKKQIFPLSPCSTSLHHLMAYTFIFLLLHFIFGLI